MKTLGDQAREFREARGWNTIQMAKAVGTSRQNIEALEAHGNRIPKYIGRLAYAMGTTVDQMLLRAEMVPKVMPSSPWPFSPELRDIVLDLQPEDRAHLETVMLAALKIGTPRQVVPPELDASHQLHEPPPTYSPDKADRGGALIDQNRRAHEAAMKKAHPASKPKKGTARR